MNQPDRPETEYLEPEYSATGEEATPLDPEMEIKIEDWITQDNAENVETVATLYKYESAARTSQDKSQVNYYRGSIPSRHEIGLQYGAGRYMLVLTRPRGVKQPRKSTSYRFILDPNYDRLKQDAEEKNARKVFPAMQGPAPAYLPPAPQDSGTALKESFSMMQNMMISIFTMLSPLLNRAVEPVKALPAPAASPIDQLGMFGALKDVLKTQTKADIDFFTEMKKGFMNMSPVATDTENETEAPEVEKPSFFERILPIIEQFIPVIAQNTTQAKVAAAGFRAIPAVQAVVKDITNNPALLQRIVNYVEEKEGREGAIIALRNMGIQTAPVIPVRAIARPVGGQGGNKTILKKVVTKTIQKGVKK